MQVIWNTLNQPRLNGFIHYQSRFKTLTQIKIDKKNLKRNKIKSQTLTMPLNEKENNKRNNFH